MFPPNLPPVKNKFLYAYRVFIKWFSFFYFGVTSIILSILILPPMRLCLHPKERFRKYARHFVSLSFRSFINIMHLLGIVNLEPGDKKPYKTIQSKIVVANHPSLLDVVMLISLIPNADCVVASYLKYSILKFIVSQLYIVSSDDYEYLFKECEKSLKAGNCLIVFPEGTRTPRTGKNPVKKGAARIALTSGCNIVPVHIGGTDKFGLGKKDPWSGFNPTERYVYKLTMKPEINTEKYKNYPRPAATRLLTKDISSVLFPEK